MVSQWCCHFFFLMHCLLAVSPISMLWDLPPTSTYLSHSKILITVPYGIQEYNTSFYNLTTLSLVVIQSIVISVSDCLLAYLKKTMSKFHPSFSFPSSPFPSIPLPFFHHPSLPHPSFSWICHCYIIPQYFPLIQIMDPSFLYYWTALADNGKTFYKKYKRT